MKKKALRYGLVVCFWLAVWQIIALIVGEELLFPSPLATAKAFGILCGKSLFWRAVGTSFLRVIAGIALALFCGALGGVIAGMLPFFKAIFDPILSVIKATPVASFIVLFVLWFNRDIVPLVIAALMVFPVVWTNVCDGIRNTDKALLETAKVYRVPLYIQIRDIYIPSVKPYFLSSARSSMGMAWKAGIAAEVIVLPLISVGRELYYASNNLETATMFAWTATVILLSVIADLLFSFLFKSLDEQEKKRKRLIHDSAEVKK